MPPPEESENGDLQFQWGRRRGTGTSNKDVHFYESFIYDEESYSLYDDVYLFKDGDHVPYVGKILKIWEQPGHKRRVKILWFFHPNEIDAYLNGYALSEKELFLASGDGVGLSNVNPLEAIAGKCCVICTSRDERNPQPSSIAIEKADYIFSQFFDVGTCTISETLPDTISGVEVKFLLNHHEDQKPDHSVNLELVDSGSLDDRPVKKLKPSIEPAKLPHDTEKKCDPATEKLIMKYDDNHVQKKVKSVDGLVKQKHEDQEVEPNTKKRKFINDYDGPDNYSVQVPKESSQMVELSVERNMSLVVPPPKPSSTALHRSKWFADMPWKARIEKAHKQGKLVFLDNLDPSYSSSEIEDVLREALNVDCTVKLIPQLTFQNPNYGQAYAIFSTRNEAASAVQELDEKCLILQDGRSLIAKFGMLELPQKAPKFYGHLKIDKGRLQPVRIEHKKAVSTSHCSQPNTIEYELALDWLLVLEKYGRSKKKLFKKQGEQLKAFMGKYSVK